MFMLTFLILLIAPVIIGQLWQPYHGTNGSNAYNGSALGTGGSYAWNDFGVGNWRLCCFCKRWFW